MLELAILIATIVLALAYAYANGMNDAANAVATVISNRPLALRQGALGLGGCAFPMQRAHVRFPALRLAQVCHPPPALRKVHFVAPASGKRSWARV